MPRATATLPRAWRGIFCEDISTAAVPAFGHWVGGAFGFPRGNGWGPKGSSPEPEGISDEELAGRCAGEPFATIVGWMPPPKGVASRTARSWRSSSSSSKSTSDQDRCPRAEPDFEADFGPLDSETCAAGEAEPWAAGAAEPWSKLRSSAAKAGSKIGGRVLATTKVGFVGGGSGCRRK